MAGSMRDDADDDGDDDNDGDAGDDDGGDDDADDDDDDDAYFAPSRHRPGGGHLRCPALEGRSAITFAPLWATIFPEASRPGSQQSTSWLGKSCRRARTRPLAE